jgi:hypothetical protein
MHEVTTPEPLLEKEGSFFFSQLKQTAMIA